MLSRLESIVDHISNLASFDASLDIRDTARSLKRLREAAKAGLASGESAQYSLEGLGAWYCKTQCAGEGQAQLPLEETGKPSAAIDQDAQDFKSTWILGSLAQALDFPLETYRPLPKWAQEDSPDSLRKAKTEAPAAASAPKSISSSNVGNVQHMETRVQAPANISNMPVVSSLEDLDLFYSDDRPIPPPVAARAGSGAGAVGGAMEQPMTLEQLRLGGNPKPPPARAVGTAVFGEDDESEEEESGEEPEDDGDDWKYCMQAAKAPAPPTSGTFAPPLREATPAKAAAAIAAAVVEAETPALAPPDDSLI